MPVDENGNPVPVSGFGASNDVNGTSAHAETAALDSGFYRLAVVSSSGTGVRVLIGTSPVAIATSTYMPTGLVETVYITNGNRISVLGGVLNYTLLQS